MRGADRGQRLHDLPVQRRHSSLESWSICLSGIQTAVALQAGMRQREKKLARSDMLAWAVLKRMLKKRAAFRVGHGQILLELLNLTNRYTH